MRFVGAALRCRRCYAWDTMPHSASPDWLDKTGYGVIGSFTLNGGEHVKAEIVDYDEETNELVVEPITSTEAHGHGERPTRAIAIDQVLSFDPEPRSSQTWLHSDPCRTAGFSFSRFTLLAGLFLGSTIGSLVLFITRMNSEPYRLQELSALPYTLAVVWLTFAAHRDAPRFLFSCPAVKPQLPHLMLRHVCFLMALCSLQTAALAVRPSLRAGWNLRDSRGETPFEITLLLLCFGLGFVEIYTSRSLLKRAHSDLNL